LQHTFATFALRAGISVFELSRVMGASLAMIDLHYGHLARDGREHAVALLDAQVDETSAWTLRGHRTEQPHWAHRTGRGYMSLQERETGRLRMPAKKKQKQAAANGKAVKTKKKKTSRGK
jgi:hypothetical protein